jgi:hypothetical protein
MEDVSIVDLPEAIPQCSRRLVSADGCVDQHYGQRVWLLALVPTLRFGRWLTAGVAFVLLLGMFWLCRVFDESDSAAQAAALFFSVIIAYIIPVYHLITERTVAAFKELEPALVADTERIEQWRARITHKTARWTQWTLAFGLMAGLAHNLLLSGSPTAFLGRFESAPEFAVVMGASLVWVVMLSVVVALIDNARLFNRLASHVDIDLIDTSPLTAFARVAVISTLALIGAQAAYPILWIGPGFNAIASLPGFVATAPPMLFLLALPIWPIHKVIAAAKAAELGRINAQLRAITNRATDADGLPAMNQLLIYRREIAAVSEWPFNASVASRLVFYLVIPPLTWIAAGLIDLIIERLV